MQKLIAILGNADRQLVEGEQELFELPQTKRLGQALTNLQYAIGYTTSVLELLRKEGEENEEHDNDRASYLAKDGTLQSIP